MCCEALILSPSIELNNKLAASIANTSLGVDGFILGTSALFGKDEDYETIIKRLKNQ